MLATGTLNRRVCIQAPTATQDASGQIVNSWTTLLHTWASIHAAPGKEIYATSGYVSELTHVVTIRYPAVSVNSTMRVIYQSRVFLVQAVSDPNEERKQLNLLCKELNPIAGAEEN